MGDQRLPIRSDGDNGDRYSRIDSVLLKVAQQRLKGEIVTDDELIERHPNLMPELAVQLRLFAELSTESPTELKQVGTLKVRCPYCHQPAKEFGDKLSDDFTCRCCAGLFRLDVPEAASYVQKHRLGHVELIEQVGAGTFGSVWKARDTELDRIVAVKVPRHGRLDSAELEQFVREARTAAQLKHPNIVSVHYVGREAQTVYIISDFVEGVTLADRIKAQPLTFREAAQLCEKIAMALHHAHQAGVVHRDIKPQNIMLDANREPHLMDFGLARRDVGEVRTTMDGRVLGTPAYMSPEQARGAAHQTDQRTDVYSLGVVLFELLTGELPFRGNVRMILHQVLHQEAPSPCSLNSSVPTDLETITLRCLEKESHRRYTSAQEVADELGRYLDGRPVLARRISRSERAWRWCKRNPILAATASVAVLLALSLAVGGRVAAWQQARLADQIRRQLYVSDMGAAMEATRRGDWSDVEKLLKRHVPLRDQDDLRGFEWYVLFNHWRTSQDMPQLEVGSHISTLTSFGENQIAIGHDDGLTVFDLRTVTSENLHRGERLEVAVASGRIASAAAHRIRLHEPNQAESEEWLNSNQDASQFFHKLRFSSGGRQLATTVWVGFVGKNWLQIWDLPSRLSTKLERDGHGFWDVCFSPNGSRIATAGWDDCSILIWDPANGSGPLEQLPALGPVGVVSYSPNGKHLVAGCGDGFIRIFARTGTGFERVHEREAHRSRITSIAFSQDGSLLASAARDSEVKLWKIDARGRLTLIEEFRGHTGTVDSVCFLNDGRIASGGSNGRVRFWDRHNNSHRQVLRGHTNLVRAVDISRDGRFVASGGHDYRLRIWDLNEDVFFDLPNKAHTIRDLVFSPDDRFIAVGSWDGSVSLWDLHDRKLMWMRDGGFPVWEVWFSPDGANVYGRTQVPGIPDRVKSWLTKSGTPLLDLTGQQTVRSPLTRNGRSIRVWGRRAQIDRNMVKLVDPNTGEEKGRLIGHEHQIWDLAFSADAGILVSASEDHTVRVWRAATKAEVEEYGW